MTQILNKEYTSKYKFIDKIVRRDGWLSQGTKNYQYRQEQIKMIDTIIEGISEKRNVVVEAPTGTGKSFGYLLAGMNEVIHENKRIAISTNTINLQEQLLSNDLPFLSDLFLKYKNEKINYSLLKGKSNYVCEKKIKDFEKEGIEANTKEEVDYIKKAIKWNKQNETGDKSEAPMEVLKVWNKVAADQHCSKNCKYENQCAFRKARKKAKKANIVILNHHTYIMDYIVRKETGKSFLGDFDVVVFDEGHHLESVAIEAFGKQLSYYSTIGRINSSIKALKKEKKKNKEDKETLQKAIKILIKIKEKIEKFWDYIREKIKTNKKQKIVLPYHKRKLNKKHLLIMKTLFKKTLKLLTSLLAEEGDKNQKVNLSETTRDKITKNYNYLYSNYQSFLMIVERQMKHEYAYWAESDDNPTMISKPIDISEKLKGLYQSDEFNTPDSLIFTSATITTNKDFRFFIKNLGLPENTITKIVKSPFNYKEQARLYVPEKSLSGTIATKNPDKYREYIKDNIIKVAEITQRGIFALFTSYAAMEATYKMVKEELPFHNLLIQGSTNKNTLLNRFKENNNSILFATYSFWEGVDVKGDDLGYVFIDKIPFEVYTDPLIVAKKDKMTNEGDNFFNDYYVPEAIIKLKQGFGRLIRTKKDYGAVIMLDDRIIPGNKRYSKTIYNSFPDIDKIFTRDFKEIKDLEKRKRKVVPISKIG